MSGNLMLQIIADTVCFPKDIKDLFYKKFIQTLNTETNYKIHPLFKELADEINSIEDIAIKNGEQGNLGIKDPEIWRYSQQDTYIEFYALNHNNRLATAFITYVTGKLEGIAEFSKLEFDEVVEEYSSPTYTYETHGDNLIDIAYKYTLSFGNIAAYVKDSEDIIKECIGYVRDFKRIYEETPTELFYIERLDDILELEDEDKRYVLEDAKIDSGILELCNAINSFESFMTMNSCQGALDESKKGDHCPLTYVDFNVASHNYYIANALLVYLSSRMNGAIKTKVSFENDGYLDDEDENVWVSLDTIIYRYRIDLTHYDYMGRSNMTSKEALDKTLELIEEFKEKFKL